jgi:nicotinamide-nucleotide amidase
MPTMKAIIITIGDELLIGQVVDTNSTWIAQQLNTIGIDVYRRVAVGDVHEDILKALKEAEQSADIILTTGGLGPTKDDITKYAINEYFGGTLVMNEEILKQVTDFFTKLKRPMLESNTQQAMVPDNCTTIKNKNGTAPGMWFERNGKVFVSMPGVPFEMKAMMKDEVIPRLKKLVKSQFIIHKTVQTAGIGESFLAEKIKDFENALPANIKLAYLPNLSLIRLRLTGHGDNETKLNEQLTLLQKELAKQVGEFVFWLEDEPIEQVVGKLLKQNNATLSTAESCTGGYIAHRITSVPGSSQYYIGSVIAYANEIKENMLGVKIDTIGKYGAVSEETVLEMAKNVREIMKTDYSLAVSGIAGPDGGTPEKPVGTIWVALADKDGVTAKKYFFNRMRMQNIELTTNYALLMLIRKLKN